MQHHLLVLAGRSAAGLLPVLVSAGTARAFGLEGVGEVATGLALAHAVAEVADGLSPRHVPRLAGEPATSRARRVAAFNAARALVLCAALVAACAAAPVLGPGAAGRLVVLTLVGAWLVASSGQYAVALASGDYVAVGFGPFVPLVILPLAFATLRGVAPHLGPWSLVLALHVARAVEVLALAARHGWPVLTTDPAAILGEWGATRYLFLQALLSVVYLRLTLPFIALLTHDDALTGRVSLGLTLLSGVSLVALATTIPAYQRLVSGPRPTSMADALARTRRDLATANAASLLMLLALWGAAPMLLAGGFHVSDPAATTLARIVLLGGIPEATGLFSGIYYHAVSADRRLFALSAVNAAAAWVMLGAGFLAGGGVGVAWGFALSRLVGVAVVASPIALAAWRREVRPAVVAAEAHV